MKEVSAYLGNTPTVARASYVDPRVIDLFNDGATISPALAARDQNLADGFTHGKIERAVLNLLQTPKSRVRAEYIKPAQERVSGRR
jgi:DNA topoisomerase IB